MMAAPDLSTLIIEDWDEKHCNDDPDRFIAMVSIHSLDDVSTGEEPTTNAELAVYNAELATYNLDE